MCSAARKSLNAQTEIGRRIRGCEKSLNTIASELVEAARKLDRIEAAQRAAKPSRGPDGKFLPKAQA